VTSAYRFGATSTTMKTRARVVFNLYPHAPNGVLMGDHYPSRPTFRETFKGNIKD